MKKLMLTTAMSLMLAGTAMAEEKVIIYEDGAQKNVTLQPYDTAPGMALVAPEVEFEGYERIPAGEYAALTADKFEGANVYGIQGEEVGEIDELILTADGKIDRVVLEVGGFLGIGEREVAVPFDRLTIMRKADDPNDFRVYIDSTQERLEALPEFEDLD